MQQDKKPKADDDKEDKKKDEKPLKGLGKLASSGFRAKKASEVEVIASGKIETTHLPDFWHAFHHANYLYTEKSHLIEKDEVMA